MTKKLFKNLEKQAQKPGNKTKQIYAACALAECHDNGIFVDEDAKKAFRYNKIAAELGDALSQCNLCICYAEGQGVEKNVEACAMWCGKAATQGYAAVL